MKFNLIFLTLAVAVTNSFLPKEVNLILIGIIIFFLAQNDKAEIYKTSFSIVLPLLLLVLLGGILGLGKINRDYYRDVFYVSKNIIYFISGIALSKYIKNFNTYFKYFAILVLISAIRHISIFFLNYHSFGTLDHFRKAFGLGNISEAIFLSMVLARFFNNDFKMLIGNFNLHYKIITLITAVSFVLYFSRSMIISLLVLLLFLSGVINIRQIFSKENKRIFSAGLIILLLAFLGSFIASKFSSSILVSTLIEKFEAIPNEIFWNEEENTSATLGDINENWRGYEAYQGILKFNKGNILQKTFGFGYGALVDLNMFMNLAGEDYAEVPTLHNGYVTLLVKCGIAGVLLYLLVLYRIGFSKVNYYRNDNPELYYLYQMLSALSIITLLNTFTTSGLLNPTNAAIPILFGLFWGNVQRNKTLIPEQL